MAHFHDQSFRAKRRRLDTDNARSGDGNVAITSPTQLRDLLVFRQDAVQAKLGVNKFKEFLQSIGQAEEENIKSQKLRILKTYCDSQISKNDNSENETAVCFSDLIQTWSFADGNGDESLLTIVPSVLALFLKTASSQLDFQEFGLALSKFLLQKEQLRLFNRGLTATKAKEHLISPCLRLLTEIVSFDGGAVARLVYSARHITYKRLDVFLTPNKAQLESSSDGHQSSTLRRNAQRYVLANLRFQSSAPKTDIIEQQKTIRAFLEHVRKDPRDMVLDIIRSIDRDVVEDADLSRNTKTKFFSRWNLERLVTLYGYDRESDEPNPSGVSIANEVHKILMNICLNTGLGVLLPETGWYPIGSDPESFLTEDDTCIELGLDSAVYVDKYRESVPVRNGTLSYLAQVLRPDIDSLQIELLLAIFKAAPELVADFFTKKTMFVSDPKPTASWMAESAFLFSTIRLPVPTNCGWKEKVPAMPPPVSVVIESILPRPLTQKILSRCINQNAEIVTLFAVRVLTVAFKKLKAVLRIFNTDHGTGQPFWEQAASKLVAEFCRRCPAMKDVTLLFRRTAKEDLQQQEAVSELLACFYEEIPDIAFEETFDVSLVLVDILKRLDTPDLNTDDSEMLLSQLRNILRIAQLSASIRWWQQPASMQYSAFTSILKVLVEAADKDSSHQIYDLLRAVLVENSVLKNSASSFAALTSSLEASASELLDNSLSFLDNCICRVAKKPVHYQDMVASLFENTSGPVSLLIATIVEQWPFVVKNKDTEATAGIATWIAKFSRELKQAGEDSNALRMALDKILEATGNKKARSPLKKALKEISKTEEDHDSDDSSNNGQRGSIQKTSPTLGDNVQSVDLIEIFGSLPTEGKTHHELQRWEKEELVVAVEEGHAAALILCLCSEYEEVRRQAFMNLSRFMLKIKDSKYTEWRAVYLLMGELLETVTRLGLETPVPWIVGECASSCLKVLTNPLHKLYGKVSRFLQKSPSWEVEKIPSYWIDKILLHEPEIYDGYFEEISWLLDLFIRALRTKTDMDIYRRANVFERVLSFYASPTAGVSSKRKILHLIYRSTQVGGSTTLVTRAAIISWIQSQIVVLNTKDASTITALAHAVYDSSEKERVDTWSGGLYL